MGTGASGWMCQGQTSSKGAPTGHVHSQSRQLCGGHGLGEGWGRIAVGACVEVTTPLSKRCLFSRKTEGDLRPGQQRPPRPHSSPPGPPSRAWSCSGTSVRSPGRTRAPGPSPGGGSGPCRRPPAGESESARPGEPARGESRQAELVLARARLEGLMAGPVQGRSPVCGLRPSPSRSTGCPGRGLAEVRETVSGREPSAEAELSSGPLQPPPQPSARPRRGPQPHVDRGGAVRYSGTYENLPSFLLGKRSKVF